LKELESRTAPVFSKSAPGYISKNTKSTDSKRYTHPNVHSSTISNSQGMEGNYPSTDEWIKKIWTIYIYMRVCVCVTHTYTIDYYSVIKKEQSFALCSNVDQLGGYYAK